MKSTLWFLFPLLGLVTAAVAQTPATNRTDGPQVKTLNGVLEGTLEEGNVRVFRAVPYAQPPVGDLRWREPQPAVNWSGVRHADRFGDRPMQPTLWKDMIFRSEKMSEDCLYLNVWAPDAATGRDFPVLVYFYGGAIVAGDGSEPRYDGAAFARRGIIVVTVNYRLGVFGFFAHPELTRESPHHASGNYGYLDQNAALRWVRANIAAFGGDPAMVTIGGQSAGSFSVSAQMASPLSRGLFRAAIAQSGSLLGKDQPGSLSEAEKIGVQFAESIGAKSLAELRRLSAESLFEKSRKSNLARPQTVIDGYFLPEQPQEIFFTGRQADVPLLAGWTTAEVDYHYLLGNQPPTPDNFAQKVRELYGDNAAEVLKLYPASNAADALRSATDLAADRFLVYRTWKLIDEHSKSGGQPVYRYLWAQFPPPEVGATPRAEGAPGPQGAPHSSELPYVFGALKLVTANAWTSADYQASEVFQGFLSNFIKTGNPNGDGLPAWPWFQASIPKVMVIDSKPHTMGAPGLRRYQFLDTH
jgi:para-nitrobenzyl esterase